ncbi:unnamed protein product [Adineta steineri]|uniref:G-protein coupled receptors family 1 profile domain-containing protein n=1 Tax=Adineta steineri TaxID=433720 RepID=A0A814J962_9BILA|nr:unnamed protein product [Adineta steineri]CAF1149356.1 unnamed protein product [Adineta steineri]CAF3718530.1 unnamed protein product [Adineta steineri]CAF3927861.1 unnamed protein product [Adineta steineri]
MVASFSDICVQLNRWILLIIIIMGIFGNLLNITIFIRPVFNHHVCSWYFFALAVNNCFYSLTVIMYHLLTDGFQIQAITNSLSLCQFISFIDIFCTSLSHYIIVLAAINRYCAGSANPRFHIFHSFQAMVLSILLTMIFCGLLAISNPIVVDLNSIDGFGCNVRVNTIYKEFYVIIQMILFVIIAPILMIIFTLLTFRDRRLIGDIPMAVSKCRHMEYHQTRMFFLLVIVYIILNLPEWIEYLILLRSNLFGSIILTTTIIRIPIYFSYILPIVWYLITGKEFRRELRKMIPILALLRRNTQVNIAVNNVPDIHH